MVPNFGHPAKDRSNPALPYGDGRQLITMFATPKKRVSPFLPRRGWHVTCAIGPAHPGIASARPSVICLTNLLKLVWSFMIVWKWFPAVLGQSFVYDDLIKV